MTNNKFKKRKEVNFSELPEKRQEQLVKFATKELAEFVINNMAEDLDAMILFYFSQEYGFGKHRLRKIFDGIFDLKCELRERWEGNDKEVVDDARRELKKIGVDIELWEKEKQRWRDGGYKKDIVWNSVEKKEL